MTLPTQLTVLRIVLAPVFFLLFAIVEPAEMSWAAGVFLVAAVTDWYDGYFARRMNLTSPLGAFLDPLADKLLTSAAFLGFATRGLLPWWMVLLVLARDIYLTVFRMSADAVLQTVKTSYFAKMKTFAQMVFIGYVLLTLMMATGTFGIEPMRLGATLADPELLYWIMAVLVSLTIYSAIQYTYDNWNVVVAVFRRYVLSRKPMEL
ncbi:MAG: CDP-diacylglycerol--glycerol-3-phosphate 3-phosphatidyltransferase [Candidatus Kapaibacterium sp.]|jgi:CDP-diacylglycerol--glycerol-3-phosphate 3-phosphatidyltransferase